MPQPLLVKVLPLPWRTTPRGGPPLCFLDGTWFLDVAYCSNGKLSKRACDPYFALMIVNPRLYGLVDANIRTFYSHQIPADHCNMMVYVRPIKILLVRGENERFCGRIRSCLRFAPFIAPLSPSA